MDAAEFKHMHGNLNKNIDEIKSILGRIKPELLGMPEGIRAVERVKYLFYGVVKFLIDVGNRIVIDRELRKPRNNADIFISLAEGQIVMSTAVPGIKKAVLAMPRIGYCSYTEILQIVGDSLADLNKCLDSLAAFYMDLKPTI